MQVVLIVLLLSIFLIFFPLPHWKSSFRPRVMYFLAILSLFLGLLPTYLEISTYSLYLIDNIFFRLFLTSLFLIFVLFGAITAMIFPKNTKGEPTLIYKIAEVAIIMALIISMVELLISIFA